MKEAEETIVAIATPLGEGGLGVVRLSGPSAFDILSGMFHSSSPDWLTAPSHTVHHGWIHRGEARIDEVLVSLFRSPRSYTGEDVIEISCHGSPLLLKEVIRLCEVRGARAARPGEFTQRAYLNGKMDLLQAEAVAELIHAKSKRAHLFSRAQLHGVLSKRLSAFRERLLNLVAHVEANLDFIEEDIPALSRERMKCELERTHKEMGELLSTSLQSRLPHEGVRVTLVGRPNVGKSSLFNAVLAMDRAIVTEIPGTTRDVLEERLDWEGMPIVLVDTAGIRATTDRLEQIGRDRSERAKELSDIVVHVIDGSTALTPDDFTISRKLEGKHTIAALNKVDKGLRCDVKPLMNRRIYSALVNTSATEAIGLDDLKKAVLAKRGDSPSGAGGPGQADSAWTARPALTHLRHVRHFESAAAGVASALEALEAGRTEESIAMDIKGALAELGAITGEAVTDDVLNKIFSQFCVGK